MAGIYLHIPFCAKRCIYCDFYSTTLLEERDAYVQAVKQELQQRKNYLQGEDIATIYIGGGTPSQLTIQQIADLLACVQQHYTIRPDAEITMEANPDDLCPEFVAQLAQLPINRISMGVQTFDDKKLRMLNRRHTAKQAVNAVKACQDAGFENVSIDLIYGLPGETLTEWENDIDTALQLNVQHLSAYHLMYEEGTPLWKLWQEHQVKQVDEDLSVTFFETLTQRLKDGGFEHYEISNFCRQGYHSRHNSSYWEGVPYLGVGAAAHSFNGTSRQWNVADLKAYITGITTDNPSFELEELTQENRYNEMVMTGLRTAKGVNLDKLQQLFGNRMLQYFEANAKPFLANGDLERTADNRIKLSHQGIFISDGIMGELMFVS